MFRARRRRESSVSKDAVEPRDVVGAETTHMLPSEHVLREPNCRLVGANSRPLSLKRCQPTIGPFHEGDVCLRLVVALVDRNGDFPERALAWGAQTRSRCKSTDPRPVSSCTPRPPWNSTASPGSWKQHPVFTEMRRFWDRQGQSDQTVNLSVFRRHPCGASELGFAC